jgi:hypothetical protein
LTAAIFGLVGVIVGGVLNGVVGWLVARGQARSSTRAIARLAYDDFLHHQSTLVRALDAGCWWDGADLLGEQVCTEDWKLLLGELGDEPSQEVASARGWMAYLISRWRAAVPDPAQAQLALPLASRTLAPQDSQLMRDTFARMDRARRQLSGKVSGRKFSSFKDGGTLATLEPPRTLEELGIDAESCRLRRKADYGRPSP